jgi:hypothetical protein
MSEEAVKRFDEFFECIDNEIKKLIESEDRELTKKVAKIFGDLWMGEDYSLVAIIEIKNYLDLVATKSAVGMVSNIYDANKDPTFRTLGLKSIIFPAADSTL